MNTSGGPDTDGQHLTLAPEGPPVARAVTGTTQWPFAH